jgi:hypothetical protein
VAPLAAELGFGGDGPSSEAILSGEYDTTGLDDNVALLIQHLQQTAEMAVLDPCPRITECEYSGKLKWFVSLSTFMARVNASFELDHNGVRPFEREHDTQHIMDIVLESNTFTAAQLRRINYCRLFLQAVTISDLTDATDTQLDASKLSGLPSTTSSTTTWLHVNQDRPSEAEWKLWRRANRLWSSQDGVLLRPLGVWLHPRSQQRQQHFAYHRQRRLYLRVGVNTYQVCKPTRNPGEYRFTARVRRLD